MGYQGYMHESEAGCARSYLLEKVMQNRILPQPNTGKLISSNKASAPGGLYIVVFHQVIENKRRGQVIKLTRKLIKGFKEYT